MTQSPPPTPRVRRKAGRPWGIILPFVAGTVVLIALVAIALVSGQSAPIADVFLTLIILCPLSIFCLLPIYLLLVVLIALMGRANAGLDGVLRRVGAAADGVEERALDLTGRAARLSIRFNTGFTRLEKLAHRIFNPHHTPDEPKSS